MGIFNCRILRNERHQLYQHFQPSKLTPVISWNERAITFVLLFPAAAPPLGTSSVLSTALFVPCVPPYKPLNVECAKK